jgi:hypothetical protein
MTSEFRSLPLNGAFDVELNDYLFEDIATPPLPNFTTTNCKYTSKCTKC